MQGGNGKSTQSKIHQIIKMKILIIVLLVLLSFNAFADDMVTVTFDANITASDYNNYDTKTTITNGDLGSIVITATYNISNEGEINTYGTITDYATSIDWKTTLDPTILQPSFTGKTINSNEISSTTQGNIASLGAEYDQQTIINGAGLTRFIQNTVNVINGYYYTGNNPQLPGPNLQADFIANMESGTIFNVNISSSNYLYSCCVLNSNSYLYWTGESVSLSGTAIISGVTVSSIPLPASIFMMFSGLCSIFFYNKRIARDNYFLSK